MGRPSWISSVVAALALAAVASGAAHAQGFPGVAPGPSSLGVTGTTAPGIAGPAVTPLAPGTAGSIPLGGGVVPIAPGPAAPGGYVIDRDPYSQAGRRAKRGTRIVTVPGLPSVVVPRSRKRESYADRVARCVQYGSAAGVSSTDIGRFTAICAN